MADRRAITETARRAPSQPLKLRPELVPKPLWGKNARDLLKGGADWKRIRADALRESGDRCSICGAKEAPPGFRDPRLYCHEVWRYDDRKGVATLCGFRMICAGCNSVVHIGRTREVGDVDPALAHLARVNGISAEAARSIDREAHEVWKARSRRQWTVAVTPSLLRRYPALRPLVGYNRALSTTGIAPPTAALSEKLVGVRPGRRESAGRRANR